VGEVGDEEGMWLGLRLGAATTVGDWDVTGVDVGCDADGSSVGAEHPQGPDTTGPISTQSWGETAPPSPRA